MPRSAWIVLRWMLAGLVLTGAAADSAGPFGWAGIVALNEKRTMLIKIENPHSPVDYGSGVVVAPQGYVLTAKHILGRNPGEDDLVGVLDATQSSIDFGSAVPLKVIYVSPTLDLAVLAAEGRRMPPGAVLAKIHKMGDPLLVLGYPNGGSLISTAGVVSGNYTEGRFASDVHAGRGNSGGPAISPDDRLLGLLVDVNRRSEAGDIELSYILSAEAIEADLAHHQGLVTVSTSDPGATSETGIEVVRTPAVLNFAYGFDTTQTTHRPFFQRTRQGYHPPFPAQPGFRITEAKISVDHRNHVTQEPVAHIVEGGRAVIVDYELESGPAEDRWRGWIDGRVETVQRREGAR